MTCIICIKSPYQLERVKKKKDFLYGIKEHFVFVFQMPMWRNSSSEWKRGSAKTMKGRKLSTKGCSINKNRQKKTKLQRRIQTRCKKLWRTVPSEKMIKETEEKMAYQNVGYMSPRAWNINPSKGFNDSTVLLPRLNQNEGRLLWLGSLKI